MGHTLAWLACYRELAVRYERQADIQPSCSFISIVPDLLEHLLKVLKHGLIGRKA